MRYQANNEESAKILLADVERYGAESVMVQWAKLVMAKIDAERTKWKLVA